MLSIHLPILSVIMEVAMVFHECLGLLDRIPVLTANVRPIVNIVNVVMAIWPNLDVWQLHFT